MVHEIRSKVFEEFYKDLETKNEEHNIYKLGKYREKKTRNLDQLSALRIKKRKFWSHMRMSKKGGRTIFVSFSMMDKVQILMWRG